MPTLPGSDEVSRAVSELATEFKTKEQVTRNATMKFASEASRSVSPEHATNLIELGRKTGVAPTTFMDLPADQLGPYMPSPLERLSDKLTPNLSTWLSNPVNAALARGEEEDLIRADTSLNALTERTRPLTYVEEQYRAAKSGARNISDAISLRGTAIPEGGELGMQLIEYALRGEEPPQELLDRIARVEDVLNQPSVGFLDDPMEWLSQAYREQIPIMLATTTAGVKGMAEGAMLGTVAGAGIGATVGVAGPAVVTGGVSIPTAPVTGAAGAATGAAVGAEVGRRAGYSYGVFREVLKMEGGLYALELRREFPDMDPEELAYVSLAVGAVNGALESLFGLEPLLYQTAGRVASMFRRQGVKAALKIPGVRAVLFQLGKTVAKVSGSEAATEYAQEFVPNFVTALKTLSENDDGYPITYDAIFNAIFSKQNLAEQAIAAGTAAVVAPGMASVTVAPETASQLLQVRRAKAVEQQILDLGKALEGKRSTAEYVENGGVGVGANLYIDADAFAAYWQQQGLDPAEVAAEVLGSARPFTEALEAKQPMAIPANKLGKLMRSPEHVPFFAMETRDEPGAMNGREYRVWMQNVLPEIEAREQQAQADLTEVRSTLTERYTANGLPQQEAAAAADVNAQAIMRMALLTGKSPKEYMEEHGYGVGRFAVDANGNFVQQQVDRVGLPVTGEFVADAGPIDLTWQKLEEDRLALIKEVGPEGTPTPEQSARMDRIIAEQELHPATEDTRFQTGKPVTVRAFHGSSSARIAEEGFRADTLGANTGAASARMGHFFAGRPETANNIDYTGIVIDQEYDQYDSATKEKMALALIKEEGGVVPEEGEFNSDYRAAWERITKDPDLAQRLWEKVTGASGKPVVYPARLHMNNPYVHDYKGERYREESYASVIARAKKAGHDGVILLNTYDGGPLDNIFVVFEDQQIEQTLYQGPARVDNLQMVAQRGERARVSRAIITPAERAAIVSSSKTTGVSEKEITDAVREAKQAHPASGGWAPLTYLRTEIDTNEAGEVKPTHVFQTVPYSFAQTDPRELGAPEKGDKSDEAKAQRRRKKTLEKGTPEYTKRVRMLSRKMLDEVRRVYVRAHNGDANAENILTQAGWYRNMRARLRQEFGGLGDLFADLLGATSPNTPVRDNWSNAVDVLRRASRGDFDDLMPQLEAWASEIERQETILQAFVETGMMLGMSKKAIAETPEYQSMLGQLQVARELPDYMKPAKESGANYGFNGRNVARALVDLWRLVKDANPDIKRGGTAPKAVNFSGNLIGFRERATIDVWAARMLQRLVGGKRIASRAEGGVSGEMRASGETTLQFGLGQDVFAEAVRLIKADPEMSTDSRLARINDDDLQALVWFIEKEIWTVNGWTSAAGEGGSFELEASLTGTQNQARVRELRKILDSSKSTQPQKDEARRELATLERAVDRFMGGLSIQQSAETQGVDFVPSNRDMANLGERVTAAIYAADDGVTVLGAKALATQGRYGSVERSLDLEVVAREGFSPDPLWRQMLEEARDAEQDSVLLSRVLREDEIHQGVDPLRHRPGVEIYFRTSKTGAELDQILAELKQEGVEYFTIAVDGRRLSAAVQGEMPAAVGVRLQYVPEFDQRYGAADFTGLSDDEIAAKVLAEAKALRATAAKVANDIADVSFAEQFWYETEVAFRRDYQERINAISARIGEGSAGKSGRAGAPVWSGQSVREGAEAAARHAQWDAEQRAQAERVLGLDPGTTGVPQPLDLTNALLQLGGEGPQVVPAVDALLQPTSTPEQETARGFYIPSTRAGVRQVNIGLMSKADVTTVIHESAHGYLDLLRDVVRDLSERASRGEELNDAQMQALDDYEILTEWWFNYAQSGKALADLKQMVTGATDPVRKAVYERAVAMAEADSTLLDRVARGFVVDDPQMQGALFAPFHELHSYGFEKYIMEGNAPSVRLRRVFQRIKVWMLSMYRDARRMQIPLTDEVRGVFDRMLATEEEIAEARGQMPQTITKASDVGWSEAKFKAYQKKVADANMRAAERLDVQRVREFQRERENWWRDQTKKYAEEARAELLKTKVYAAIDILARKPGDKDGLGVRISRDVIREQWPDLEKALDRHGVLRIDDSADPDELAPLLGYRSGDEMVREMAATQTLSAASRDTADARMRAEHGDRFKDAAARTDDAIEAVLDEGQADLIEAEMQAIAEVQRQVGRAERVARAEERAAARGRQGATVATLRGLPPRDMFRRMAAGRIAQTKERDLDPRLFLATMQRAGRAAKKALAKQDYMGAQVELQAEMLNLELYLQATKAKREFEQRVKRLRELGTRKQQARLAKVGGGWREQINKLLDRYDLRPVSIAKLERREREDQYRKQTLADWIKEQEEQHGVKIDLPPEVMDSEWKPSYRDMTMDEFDTVYRAVMQLDKLARYKDRLLKIKRDRALSDLVDDLNARAEANSNKAPQDPTIVETSTPVRNRAKWWRRFWSAHRKAASLVQRADGFDLGLFWETFILPAHEAGVREAEMRADATVKLQELLAPILEGQTVATKAQSMSFGLVNAGIFREKFYPELGVNLSRVGLVAMALNWGTHSNRDRLLTGYGWDETTVQRVLDANMTREDWQLVENVWEYVNSFWPEVKALAERTEGVAPEKIEGMPVTTPYGVIQGAYYPIGYNPDNSVKALSHTVEEAAKRSMDGATFRSSTKAGSRNERVQGTPKDMRVNLSLDVLFNHVADVIHDITHYETVVDLNRIMRNRKFRTQMQRLFGNAWLTEMDAYVERVAAGDGAVRSNAVERVMLSLRAGVSIAFMGFKISTAAIQVTGYAQSYYRLRSWLGNGLLDFYSNPLALVKEINGKSSFMKHRPMMQNRDIAEVMGQMHGSTGFQRMAFALIVKMQQIVDYPTWQGAYLKALHEGRTEPQAIQYADQTVKDTQMGGQAGDLPAVMADSTLLKMLTSFYSYMNTTFNLTAESVERTNWSKPKDIGAFIVDMLILYTLPSTLMVLLTDMLTPDGDDDKDDEESFASKVMAEQLSMMLGSVVILRELSGIPKGFTQYSGPAGYRGLASLVDLAVQIGQGEFDEALLRSLNETGGIFLKYPSSQVDRTVRGLIAIHEGEVEGVVPSIQAIVAGPPPKQ